MEKKVISELVIAKIIVHVVPKHLVKDTSPTIDYSEKESELDEEMKLFFRDKIIQAIDRKGFKVFFDEASPSPLPKIIHSLIKKPNNNFVDESKKAAKSLYDIQKGYNPGGILVLIIGKVDKLNIISILKLERDRGAQLQKDDKEGVINIRTVKNLMLTEKTRLYKVGLFFSKEDFNCDFDGYISDEQLSIESPARFFLTDFLGCKLYGDMRQLTKEFFDLSSDFIYQIEDPIKKANYINHLISYSTRPKKEIDYKEFALYLEEENQQDYIDYLNQHNFDQPPIQKDTELIQSHISRIHIDFDNDISIIARKGELTDKVKLSKADNGKTKAEIEAKVTNVYS